MKTIKLRSKVGVDGILHLDIPIRMKETELEVTVTFKPIVQSQPNPEKLGWSPGFFEHTAGAWEGEPLVRGSQGEYEQREELL